MPKVNNRPSGENASNLVTLLMESPTPSASYCGTLRQQKMKMKKGGGKFVGSHSGKKCWGAREKNRSKGSFIFLWHGHLSYFCGMDIFHTLVACRYFIFLWQQQKQSQHQPQQQHQQRQ
jgi:hypothetical protein